MIANISIGCNVRATVFDEHGNITQVVDKHNNVTKGKNTGFYGNCLIYLMQRLFGSDGNFGPTPPALSLNWDSSYPVGFMELGTGGDDTHKDDGLVTPAYSSEEAIVEHAWTIEEVANRIEEPEIKVTTKWTAALGYGEFVDIDEVALQVDSGDDANVVAYATFSPKLSKTAGGTLQIDWIFTMTSTDT